MVSMVEGSFAEAIDVIEESYEFMLAYAAQGRAGEEEPGGGIRERLMRTERALGTLASSTLDTVAASGLDAAVVAEFLDVVKADAARVRSAFRFVLAQSSIGSQIIDNLNATTHMRTLLTDLFLLDEAIKITGL
jgi:hypothetical protein